MDSTARRTTDATPDSLDDAERGWSRFAAFPIMLVAIVGLLWRGRRAGRDGGSSLVPDVPHPRVLEDARLR